MSNTWVISDTHFKDGHIINQGFRPRNNDQLIQKYWRNMVKPDDLVIHLGDVILSNSSAIQNILEYLPGRKVLCMGNHDKHKASWYMSKGFDFACDTFVLDGVLFSHKPLLIPDGLVMNIHGHIHIGDHEWFDKESNDVLSDRHILVSLEASGFKPVLLKHILAKKDGVVSCTKE